MSKQKQQTLFAFGVTRHVKLPSGREVEVKEKDIAGEGEIEKVGSKKCKFVTSLLITDQLWLCMCR